MRGDSGVEVCRRYPGVKEEDLARDASIGPGGAQDFCPEVRARLRLVLHQRQHLVPHLKTENQSPIYLFVELLVHYLPYSIWVVHYCAKNG